MLKCTKLSRVCHNINKSLNTEYLGYLVLLNVTAVQARIYNPTHTHTHYYKCMALLLHTVFVWPFAGVLRDVALTNLQTVIGPL